MRRFFCLAVLFYFSANCFAQTKTIDSLTHRLNEHIHDTERVNTLLQIVNQYYLESPEKALEYGERALSLSTKIKYKIGSAQITGWIGFIHNNMGNRSEALRYYNKSLRLKKELFEETGKISMKSDIANSINNIATIHNSLGDVKQALDYYQQSLRMLEEVDDKVLIANCMNNIAVIYKEQGDIALALDYFNEGLVMQEKAGNQSGVAISLNNIGFMYRTYGDPSAMSSKEESSIVGNTKALEFFLRSLQIREELKGQYGICLSE